MLKLLSIDTQVLHSTLEALGAKIDAVGGKVDNVGAEVRIVGQQGRALASSLSIVRKEVEKMEDRLLSALPSALPRKLRHDWADAFGPTTSTLELREFTLGLESHLGPAAWSELLACLKRRIEKAKAAGDELRPEVLEVSLGAESDEGTGSDDDGDSSSEGAAIQVEEVALELLAKENIVYISKKGLGKKPKKQKHEPPSKITGLNFKVYFEK